MRSTVKLVSITLSAIDGTEFMDSLSRKDAIRLQVDSDVLPGSSHVPGVMFERSYGTQVRSSKVLPPEVMVELAQDGVKVNEKSYIALGQLKGNGKHFGSVILVATPGNRQAEGYKTMRSGSQVYDMVRRYLV